MINNNICFTADGWNSAKMALGHFFDENIKDTNGNPIDLWGLVAPSIVGTLLAGRQLYIIGTDATGDTTLFRVDGQGVYSYNSRQYWEGKNHGAIGVDPKYGLMLGVQNPFVTQADGTVVPKCIDENGELKLDKDGFPEGMNVWLGIDGKVYIRGHLVMESGAAHGDFYANNFYFNDGGNIRTILSESQKKISSDWLDLLGINIKDTAGNTMMTIDGTDGITINKGSISWDAVTGTDEIDQRIQNAQDTADDASDEASSVSSNLLKLVQGKYSTPKSTFIDGTTVKSPIIEAGKFFGCDFYSDVGGGIHFMTNNMSTQWGSITYESNGLNIGALDGLILDAGLGVFPRAKDEYGTAPSRIITENYLKNNPPHAVFA